MKNRIFVDLHVLQTVPPSCVNRDDTGSPKTAQYGGVTRSRVSSQCWKRAQREMFGDIFEADKLGLRTTHIGEMVAAEIRGLGFTGNAEKAAFDVLAGAGLKLKDGTDKKSAVGDAKALFFMSRSQAKALAEIAVNEPEKIKDKKYLQAALTAAPAIDVALFGRMVADDPSLNNDACAQVAHGISTHSVVNEYDYFTAVDDLQKEDNAGAGHLGTVEFNSSTLYRYSTVAVHELYRQLGDDTVSAVRGFIEAFVRSMPTGKLNTFANRTLPDAVYVCVRSDQPVNLVGAFEKPVTSYQNGYVENSVKALCCHADSVYTDYTGKPLLSFAVGQGLDTLTDTVTFPSLLDRLTVWLGDNGDLYGATK